MGNESDQKRGAPSGTGSGVDDQGPAPGKQTASPFGPGIAPDATAVGAEWAIDWVNRQTGAIVNGGSTQRTGNGDAAYGELKIRPESGAGQVVSVNWVNAAKVGAVTVGKGAHIKDKGGMVGTSIEYGRTPSVMGKVEVKLVSVTDNKAAPPPPDFAAKQKLASTAALDKLAELLRTQGNLAEIRRELEAAAHTALGSPPPGYRYDVQLDLTSHVDKAASKSPAEKPYATFTAPGRRKITVVTQSELEKVRGTQALKEGSQNTKEDNKAVTTTDGKTHTHEDATRTSASNSMKLGINVAFRTAWERFKESKTSDSGKLHGYAEGHLGGKEQLGAGIKDFKVDLGKIAALLAAENPPLALVLKSALGTATVDGKFDVNIDGHIGGNAGFEKKWSKEEVKRELDKMNATFNGQLDVEIKSSVDTYVRDLKVEEHRKVETEGSKQLQGKQRVVDSATETLGVKVLNHDPEIEVTSE